MIPIVIAILVKQVLPEVLAWEYKEYQQGYPELEDPDSVAPGKKFSPAQKEKILEANKKRNEGELRSDLSGTPLVEPQQHVAGV